MANTETNYSFEKVNQAIADKTPDANLDAYDNLVALAKSLNKKV